MIALQENESFVYYLYLGVRISEGKLVHAILYLEEEPLSDLIDGIYDGSAKWSYWTSSFFKDAGLSRCNAGSIFKVVRIKAEEGYRYYTKGSKSSQYVGMITYEKASDFLPVDRAEMEKRVLCVSLDARKGLSVHLNSTARVCQDRLEYDKKYRSEQRTDEIEKGLTQYRDIYQSMTRESRRLFLARVIEVITGGK